MFDFQKLKMTFKKGGNKVTLQGTEEKASLNVILGKSLVKIYKKEAQNLIGTLFDITVEPEKNPIPSTIKQLLHTYQDVFSEPKA